VQGRIAIGNDLLAGPEEIHARVDHSAEIAQIILGRRTELAREALIMGIVSRTDDETSCAAPVAYVGYHSRLNLGKACEVAAHVVEQDAKDIRANLVDLRYFGAQ
jgi:hypothetical protein